MRRPQLTECAAASWPPIRACGQVIDTNNCNHGSYRGAPRESGDLVCVCAPLSTGRRTQTTGSAGTAIWSGSHTCLPEPFPAATRALGGYLLFRRRSLVYISFTWPIRSLPPRLYFGPPASSRDGQDHVSSKSNYRPTSSGRAAARALLLGNRAPISPIGWQIWFKLRSAPSVSWSPSLFGAAPDWPPL